MKPLRMSPRKRFSRPVASHFGLELQATLGGLRMRGGTHIRSLPVACGDAQTGKETRRLLRPSEDVCVHLLMGTEADVISLSLLTSHTVVQKSRN